jgi:hypothetical protein
MKRYKRMFGIHFLSAKYARGLTFSLHLSNDLSKLVKFFPSNDRFIYTLMA